ncbi:MaoC/PaaZ C-terminal domain-containing protein [Nocardia spumae]|uniref:MaoC/PaaZ C-terminal domain-containing protein n=1 Tax=Nocardia spumae TaxID=2887190 RepID=UPI001D1501E3|nr:MaoC/PaaZ C-terminal domain-containing protein [Nocardia spumae]
MSMNLGAIGADNGFGEVTWTHRDAILYALGVGAGQADPLAELQYTTENSEGVTQQMLPVFGVVLGMTYGKRPNLGDYHLSKVLHGEQSFTVHTPLPVAGSAKVATVVTGIYDKGKSALAVMETTVADAATDQAWLTSRTSLFIRGEGGFGGEPQPPADWQAPGRPADIEVSAQIRTDQTLLYRLSGDRNPLHSDPKFAAKAGFPRPILHGMCTYGVTGRLLVNALCDGDTTRVKGMDGRFSKPVMPGAELTVSIWKDNGKALFQTRTAEGDVVLDRGTFDYEAV